jgi:hypothetical protein
MQTRKSLPAQPFTVVVAYEDYISGLRALELHHRILARWADKVDFRLIIWKFEPMGVPSLMAKAIQDAITADLIVISSTGSQPLPPEATQWISGWRQKTIKEPALALLVDAEHKANPHARKIFTFCREVAGRSGMPFFSSLEKPEEPVQFHSTFADNEVLHAALHRDEFHDHWGLND